MIDWIQGIKRKIMSTFYKSSDLQENRQKPQIRANPWHNEMLWEVMLSQVSSLFFFFSECFISPGAKSQFICSLVQLLLWKPAWSQHTMPFINLSLAHPASFWFKQSAEPDLGVLWSSCSCHASVPGDAELCSQDRHYMEQVHPQSVLSEASYQVPHLPAPEMLQHAPAVRLNNSLPLSVL